MYTEIARGLVNERKLARFLTLAGVQGITSPIASLFRKCRRLCHPRIKQKKTEIVPVDVTVSKRYCNY